MHSGIKSLYYLYEILVILSHVIHVLWVCEFLLLYYILRTISKKETFYKIRLIFMKQAFSKFRIWLKEYFYELSNFAISNLHCIFVVKNEWQRLFSYFVSIKIFPTKLDCMFCGKFHFNVISILTRKVISFIILYFWT